MEQRTLIKGSRKLVGVAAGVLLVIGLLLVAQGFIDTKDYRNQVIGVIKEKTGKDVLIKGKISATLLPRPALYIPGIELRGEGQKDSAPSFTAKAVRINAAVLSLFSDELQVSSVAVEGPALEIRRDEEGAINWDWIRRDFIDTLLVSNRDAKPVSVDITDGKLFYYNELEEKNFSIRNINLSSDIGLNPQAGGYAEINDRVFSFEINTNAGEKVPSAGKTPLNIKLYTAEQDSVELSAILDNSKDSLNIEGDFLLSSPDLLSWIGGGNTKEQDATLPFKVTGKWVQTGWNIDLKNSVLEGIGSNGTGEITFSWDTIPSIVTDMQFSELQYEQWEMLVSAVADYMELSKQKWYREFEDQDITVLPDEIKVVVNASADEFSVGGQAWKNAQLSATLEDAAITVNQFIINLPDAASLTLFGIVSQNNAKKLRFEGSMETQGKSLRNLLTLFDESASGLPDTAFGDFYVHSNIFVSSEQVRLSEASVKLNELQLNGGMVAYFDGKPRIEADVKLRDINFDYFRDIWRETQKNKDTSDFFLRFDKSQNFAWLKRLRTNIDFKVIVDKFTFLEREGETAAFRLFAQPGELGIYNMRFYYPDDTVEASFNLNVKDETPFITFLYNSSGTLNTDYFMAAAPAAVAIEPELSEPEDLSSLEPSAGNDNDSKRWSSELIDMSWMDGYNGSFDISIGKLVHDGREFSRLKMKTRLRNQLVTIQALSFIFWQGRFDVTGSLYGGRVPGLSVGFTLTNANLSDIIGNFSERNNITGRLGVSGSLSTSGVNMLSWVKQADAKLVLNGVGVNVDGFNLQGVMDTVAVSRTTADVVNNVNRVLIKGSTRFSLEGYLNAKNGVIKTPGITLKSGSVMGNLTGEIKLIPWTMNLSTLFQFPAITSETIPTMGVQLTGSVDDSELRTDTDSLEAYVSKRIVGE
ncbi:MAG: AsmA family protein [Rickettsiales bacterium]